MVVIYKEKYDPVQLRQFLTRVRREIENQRDLFWGIIVTMAMGGEKHRIQELPQSMKEAVQLCKNRITGGKGGWLSWDAGDNETREDYEMLPEERKYFQEIGEYLDSKKISMEVARTEGIMTARRASGSQIYDCYMEISDAVLTGIRQNEKLDIDKIRKDLIYGFYRCTTTSEAFGFLREYISDLIENFEKKKETKEQKPITEARKYIQEHYLEPLKLEDVSKHIGFNATYFSSVFKKETGKNFLDYVTELRMNKAKQLLCSGEMSVNDVAEAVGYQDLKYFSRLFKKNAGISPSDYKKMYQ
jgi:two-component system response regulator YesN